MQVPFLGRAPRTKETLPDFLKWCRVTRPPLVFRRLTGSQRTPGCWGVTLVLLYTFILCAFILYFSYTVIMYYSYTSYTFVRSYSIIYFMLPYTLCTFLVLV